MLRCLIFYLVFPIWTVLVSLLCCLLVKIGAESRLVHWFECLWARLSLSILDVRITADLSCLESGKHYVFLCNHQSNFDILILFSALKDYNFRFLAKEELFRIPIFGTALRMIGHIPIIRENRRKAMRAIDDTIAAAKAGLSILIFPEGTRSLDHTRFGEFQTGGMVVALKCAIPVAPLVISGSGLLMRKGSWRIASGTVKLLALPVVDAAAKYTLKERETFKNDLKTNMEAAFAEMNS